MPNKKSHNVKKKKKSTPILPFLMIIGAVGVLIAASGFTFGATQEEHDAFCSSCHTQPESTFYQRSTAAVPVDMASFHTTKAVKCIDCHSGNGIFGRVGAEMLGAHNALAWYTNTAVQPAKETVPISDENCLKCHAQVPQTRDMNNHFHYFLSQWQAVDPNAASCISCHGGHNTDGDTTGQVPFQNIARTQAICDACHSILRN